MTIQEAIKSGKRFRRTGHDWCEPVIDYTEIIQLDFTLDTLTATDWEVEGGELPLEHTEAELRCMLADYGVNEDPEMIAKHKKSMWDAIDYAIMKLKNGDYR